MNPRTETLGQIFQNAAIQLQEAIRDGLKKRIAEDLDTRARAAGCTIRPHHPIVYAAGIDGGGSPQVDGWYWACPDCDKEIMCKEYMCICRGLCIHRKSHVHGLHLRHPRTSPPIRQRTRKNTMDTHRTRRKERHHP